MALACKYCIATKSLKGSEIDNLPQNEEELFQHIESEHHIPVIRKGETEEQTLKRFRHENPEAYGLHCKCPACSSWNSTISALVDTLKLRQIISET
jgi:hypothetical protein